MTFRLVLARARLSDEAFQARHRVLRFCLWLTMPLLGLFALLTDRGAGAAMAGMHGAGATLGWVMAAVMVACGFASLLVKRRRLTAAAVSLGLLLAASLLVSIGGGRTDLHFGYFLVLGMISLYQDWLPLLMSIVLVTVEHLVMGLTDPTMLYSDPRAMAEPIRYALLHAAFILGTCAVQIVYWQFTYRAQLETEQAMQRLAYEASHDNLTSLVNRAELLRALTRAIADGPGVAVLYLDLDGFKQVNDTYGHETGDALLVSVAESLRRSVLGSDLVGRLGGDEFAVVLRQVQSADDAVTVAKRILSELGHPVTVNGTSVQPRASVGIALCGGRLKTDELLHRADTAMYHAKREEGPGWRLYIEGMHDPDDPARSLEDDLAAAIADGQLRLHYQPVVTLDSGELVGVEALVRWQHPEHGLLLPEEFLPLAEQNDLIDEIGRWVLERSARQVRRWQQKLNADGLTLSVNLARRQLESPDLIPDVVGLLEATGLRPTDLIIEVAESAVIDADPVLATMTELHDAGIRFALDDFGTGYSSLRHLARLPVDILKLDNCFVSMLDGTAQGSAVAEAVVRLAHVLHLDTVAEGVESAAQATELTLLGCRYGQGFHFATPMPAEDLDALLAAAPFGARPHLPAVLSPTKT